MSSHLIRVAKQRLVHFRAELRFHRDEGDLTKGLEQHLNDRIKREENGIAYMEKLAREEPMR